MGVLLAAGFLLPDRDDAMRRKLAAAVPFFLGAFLLIAILAVTVQGAKLSAGAFPSLDIVIRYLTRTQSGKIWLMREIYVLFLLVMGSGAFAERRSRRETAAAFFSGFALGRDSRFNRSRRRRRGEQAADDCGGYNPYDRRRALGGRFARSLLDALERRRSTACIDVVCGRSRTALFTCGAGQRLLARTQRRLPIGDSCGRSFCAAQYRLRQPPDFQACAGWLDVSVWAR